jgi:restriction system protein
VAKRRGLAEDLIGAFSRLPWWVGVIVAVVAYGGLHLAASLEVAQSRDVADIGRNAGRQLFKTVATIGQWVIPALILLGSIFSLFRQRSRRALHRQVGTDQSGSSLQSINWRQFETLVHEYFDRKGFSVSDTPSGADGGVDLRLKRGSDLYLVQCKHWKAAKVGVEIVRELYGVMSAERAVGGFVVTSGQYTAEARRFAEGREIELVDGKQLGSGIRAQLEKDLASAAESSAQADQTSGPPDCPTCSSKMVKRVAAKGQLAGQSFWGCSKYPACRGIRSISYP